MIVVILAGSVKEGDEFRRVGNLARRDVVIPASGNRLRGLLLTADDLVVEFKSFAAHPRATEIRAGIEESIKRGRRGRPVWETLKR